jgi:hypothetical protein
MQSHVTASQSPTSRAPTGRTGGVLATALGLVLLAATAMLPACADDGEPDPVDDRCGGGAPQCCCDLQREEDRYQVTCRAACEDNPERPDGVCVSETACGGF